MPALLCGVPVVGVLALAAALGEGVHYPQAVVVLSFLGAGLTTCAYLLAPPHRQPGEASLWGAAALWFALFSAAVFDLSDVSRGPLEGALVWCVWLVVFLALWLPYLWSRRASLPHATAWTLAAAATLPYALALLLPDEPAVLQLFSPLVGAILSTAAGFAAWAFASRGLPASARLVVLATALVLVGGVSLEARLDFSGKTSDLLLGGGLAALPLLLSLKRMGLRASMGLRAMLCERGFVLVPLFGAVAAGYRISPDGLALLTLFGGAIALATWWVLVLRRSGSEASQSDAVLAMTTWLRSAVMACAIFGTVGLCGFLILGLATNRSSAETLVELRAAGLSDIDEVHISGAILRDQYLWRDQAVARKRPTRGEFESPLDFWTRPEFDRWSGAGFGESGRKKYEKEAVGTGLVVALEGRTTTVVLSPAGSPAHALGIRRGDRIVPPEERSPDDRASPRGRSVFEIDFPMTVTIASPDGSERTVALTTEKLRQGRVVRSTTIGVGGRQVGYVALLRFDRTGEREFVDAMASFRARGVRALVVDLRYNPGGRLYSAAQIAGAIVGERGRGEVFATTHHNSRYRDRDGVLRFQVPAGGGLGAEQLVVITSDASCSASELLVKGLEPYLPVATVGTTTCGKPVGSTAVESGSWRYSVISFAVRNARGEGEYFEGLAPTCVATDDLARELGDTAEASLREALHYLETGRCSGPA